MNFFGGIYLDARQQAQAVCVATALYRRQIVRGLSLIHISGAISLDEKPCSSNAARPPRPVSVDSGRCCFNTALRCWSAS